jgi:hypothetical protein
MMPPRPRPPDERRAVRLGLVVAALLALALLGLWSGR